MFNQDHPDCWLSKKYRHYLFVFPRFFLSCKSANWVRIIVQNHHHFATRLVPENLVPLVKLNVYLYFKYF